MCINSFAYAELNCAFLVGLLAGSRCVARDGPSVAAPQGWQHRVKPAKVFMGIYVYIYIFECCSRCTELYTYDYIYMEEVDPFANRKRHTCQTCLAIKF